MHEKWKVVIADDEAIIRDGIRSSVPWEELGLIVAGEAEDGEEALELAQRAEAHIVLVDLSMPIMNGLTLIGHLRERLPQAKIVIITGHDEFSYAYEAIKLEVDDYILKPVNPAALREVLRRIAGRLNESAVNEELLKLASEQIEKNMSILRERFCLEWLKGELSEGEAAEQLTFLRMPSTVPDMLGVIRWPEQSKGKTFYSEKDRQLLLFAIENILEEHLASETIVHCRNELGMIVLLLWGAPDRERLARFEQAVLEYLSISLISCYLDLAAGELSASYAEAKAAVLRETKLSPIVRRTKEIIGERYADRELSLESIAAELNVVPAYLSRLFKQEVGTSFISLLTQTRIKQAIRLLNETDLPMQEIAEQTGYETQHYFSTAFKKSVGLPPGQYRKSR